MPASYLTTKLHQPNAKTGEIPRQRLFEKMDSYLKEERSLFLVSAPPGFGKTTIVSTWTRKTSIPTAWLSLEKSDNEPFRFWQYVIAAYRTIFVNLSEDLLNTLNSPQILPKEIILPILLNFLENQSKRCILVLDDYHLIESQEIHNGVEELLNHLPNNYHVVICTRSDPPLHLAHRRSKGQLCEIRASDLRFNLEETLEFYKKSMQVELSLEDVKTLESRTEGWIAGLKLAGISLRDTENTQDFIKSFHGENRFISDYLVEEVLSRQPEHIQKFLMQTSFLQRFNAALCDAITGRNDSIEILNQIEDNNLFLIPLDNQRIWFRYHNLFARILNKKFEITFGLPALKSLLSLASDECARQGLLVESIQYLFDAGNFEKAARTIQVFSKQFYQQNDLPLLVQWTKLIPANILSQLPGLCVTLGWAAHATGNPELVKQLVDYVETYSGLTVNNFLLLPYEEQRQLHEEILAYFVETVVLKLRLAIDEGISQEEMDLFLQILPWLVPDRDNEPYVNNSPSQLRPVMLFQAGLAYQLLGKHNRAQPLYMESIAISQKLNNHFLVSLGMGYLGQVQAAQGKLSLAETTWQEALLYAKENGYERDAFFSVSIVGLGHLAYERNELDQAEKLLIEGISLAKNWAAWQGILPGYTQLAIVFLAKNAVEKAEEALSSLKLFQKSAPKMILPAIGYHQALVLSRQGKPEVALKSLENEKPVQIENRMIFLEILISSNQLKEAEILLDSLEKETLESDLNGYLIKILSLKAVLLLMKGEEDTAQITFEEALLMGEKECYIRTFLDIGEPLLLLKRIDNPELTEYRTMLLKNFSQNFDLPGSDIERANALLLNPLTNRELEILQRISQGDDNQTIADHYTISINTVKKHISHLFEKLEVENRIQAIEKAHQLGILK